MQVTEVELNDQELAQLMHLKSIYEKTTKIASHCFDTCLARSNIGRVEESDKNCISNCAANFLHTELLFMRRLVNAANAHNTQSP